MRIIVTLAVDVVLTIVFAAIGRLSHGEDAFLPGLVRTAWPFVVAAVVGSLLASWLGGGSWWLSGLIVWVVTAAGGIGLRLLAGDTARGAFALVTAITLAILLIGWRALAQGWLETGH